MSRKFLFVSPRNMTATLADTEDPKMRAHLQQIINDLSVRAAGM